MKTLITDDFDEYGEYRRNYKTIMTRMADAFRRAGSFGSRNG